MPHFICRWPGGDVLLASVESRQELDTILQERCEPGVCKVARYHGPLVLELKPDVPGISQASAERFRPGPPAAAFSAAWHARSVSGDVLLLAADGGAERVHKLVLQCRLPVLKGRTIAAGVKQIRLACVPDAACLASLVAYLYLDATETDGCLTSDLHRAALACGLDRLVLLCEARFAQQLELQLISWQGLGKEQQEGVLDSFIGWARYADALERAELKQLCVHALARHVTAASSRPGWPLLGAATTSLVQLIAASTAPPLIHRQLLTDGSSLAPVHGNPGPSAAAAVVSVDAEAFAAAGGRLTSAEWQQLQQFRSAVAESCEVADASPLLLAGQAARQQCSLTSPSPHIAFTVRQPVLGPHKRLMDSVCRFAFPATHSLLGSGWRPGAADAAAAVAHLDSSPGAPAAAAEAEEQVLSMPLPAPAVPAGDMAAAELAAAGSAAPAAADEPAAAVEAADEPSSSTTFAPEQLQPPATIAGDGAAAAAAGGSRSMLHSRLSGNYSSTRRSSHGRGSSLRPSDAPCTSWGSGIVMGGAEPQQGLQGGDEQQQQGQPGALPAHIRRLLHEGDSAIGSWGSGALSPVLSQRGSVDAEQHQHQHQQQQQNVSQPVPSELHIGASGDVLELPAHRRLPNRHVERGLSAGGVVSTAGSLQAGAAAVIAPAAAAAAASPAAASPSARPSGSSGAAAGGTSAAAAAATPLCALQRALVEDFVLYEEASAARQHVVSILVAIEQGDGAAGQRLMAPSCAELVAATAPAPVPNRLAAFMPAGGAAGGDSTAVSAAVRAAQQYMAATQGVVKLLGMASCSRAALEAPPTAQQQRLLRALHRISTQLPELARLLDGAEAGAGPSPGESSPGSDSSQAGVAAGQGTAAASGVDLGQAVADLLQLPELLQGLQVPVLMTQEQYQQRQQQLQQLARQAAAALEASVAGNSGGSEAGASPPAAAAPGSGTSSRPSSAGGADPVSSVLCALTAAAAAAGRGARTHLRISQTGGLFNSIISSVGAAVALSGAGQHPVLVNGMPTGAFTSAGSAGASAAAAAAAASHLGSMLHGAPAGTATALLAQAATAAVAAASGRQAGGALGLLGLPSHGAGAGPAGVMMAAMGSAAVAGAAAGAAAAAGVFTPTGVGALLAGGLLAEGGVTGDSVFDDMAADMLLHGAASVRRITCHGLYELCAALASNADAMDATPTGTDERRPQSQQEQPPPQQAQTQQCELAASVLAADVPDDFRSSSGGGSSATTTAHRASMGTGGLEATAAKAEPGPEAANGGGSWSATHAALCGHKRRLSGAAEAHGAHKR